MNQEEDRVHPIISDYEWRQHVDPLAECGRRMEALVQSALNEAGLIPHSVSHRIKARDSVDRKIERKARPNYGLSDITDLLGVRVITYFNYEVNDVAQIIEEQFAVDRDNSVDKRTQLDPDRFGYLSLHYVVTLDEHRLELPEYRRFAQVKFEIQVRSILQHAWAEIEHDLGYKSEQAVPAHLRRRFSRLAGLLELADEEFANIRHDLKTYEKEVDVAVRGNELDVKIDRESVAAYIRESPRLERLEQSIAKALGSSREDRLTDRYAEARANELHAVGLVRLEDVDKRLERDGELLWRFVRNWIQHRERGRRRQRRALNSGVLLLYVAIVEAMSRPIEEARSLLDHLGVGAALHDQLSAEMANASAELT